jgi:hypothetical protein
MVFPTGLSCTPRVQQVIRAVQDSKRELLLTGLLVLFILYAYAVVGFVYFRWALWRRRA